MEIFNTQQELSLYLENQKAQNLKIALVPTMGALHDGHLSLIQQAQEHADLVVCSIFVNPTQFNDPGDLAKYPKPIEQDIALLKHQHCDVLFLPSVEEMYPDPNEKWQVDLGKLEQIWEGEHRPGHFQGVTQIVYKLFALVQPDIACFGQKDFQQVMVIQKMIDIKNLPITLVICPIVRDENGLALSSRNIRLSEDGKKKALVLSKVLNKVRKHFRTKSLDELHLLAIDRIKEEPDVKLEYFAICETRTLEQAHFIESGKKYVALIVAWVEGVRLIDNMLLGPEQ